jgi:hypothetical protein
MHGQVSIRKLPGRLLAGVLLASLWFCPSATAAEAGREMRIKAAVIYKLAKYIEWPETSFAQAHSPLRLCWLGDTPLADALQAAAGRTIHDHPIIVSRIDDQLTGEYCHLLYISRDQQQRLPSILARLGEKPVLSISEIEDFAQQGGIIGLIRRGTRLGFQVNIGSAQRAGLTVSAPLLELAELIGRES